MCHACVIPPEDLASICAADFVPWEKLRGKTLLITGATGLIGFTLTSALLYANEKRGLGLTVLALVRNEEQARRRFGSVLAPGMPLRFLTGTVEEPPKVEGPVDYIIHGASQTASIAFVQQPVETIRTSVLGTMRMLDLGRQKNVSGFVYLSSMEVYGHPPRGHKVKETDICSLRSADVRGSYPISKLQCESLCCAYAAEYGVPAAIARLAQTFGPGVHPEDTRIFAEFGRCIRDRRDIVLRTRGETERSYLYTADAATALLTILLKGQPGQAYNAADESTYCSIAEMARRLADANGIGVRFALEENGKRGYPDPLYMDLDTSRLRALGWTIRRRNAVGDDALLFMFKKMILSFSLCEGACSVEGQREEEPK